jgi:hypothetical protein
MSLRSPAATRVEIVFEGKRADGVTIEPGQTLTPERVQLRLHGLKVDLPDGRAVPVMLHMQGMEPLELQMAIGEDTMNPQKVVELPHGHAGDTTDGDGGVQH